MWKLDSDESWASKYWCFSIVVLEKTLESPLDYKEIQSVHSKDQSWVFIGRTDAEAEAPILWPPDNKELTHLKRPWCWQRLKAGRKWDDRGWDGWMAPLTQRTWVWQALWVGDGQGSLVCCSSWGHKELDTTERLNWTELTMCLVMQECWWRCMMRFVLFLCLLTTSILQPMNQRII